MCVRHLSHTVSKMRRSGNSPKHPYFKHNVNNFILECCIILFEHWTLTNYHIICSWFCSIYYYIENRTTLNADLIATNVKQRITNPKMRITKQRHAMYIKKNENCDRRWIECNIDRMWLRFIIVLIKIYFLLIFFYFFIHLQFFFLFSSGFSMRVDSKFALFCCFICGHKWFAYLTSLFQYGVFNRNSIRVYSCVSPVSRFV